MLTEAPMVGQLAPDFTLTTAVSQSHTLSNYIGQPIVLNFWATWCGPCRIEMPYFQEASEKYNGRVTFLGINDGETPTLVTDFAAEYGVTYPLLLDNGRSVNILYNIRSLPTTLFINANGTVDEIIIGTINQGVLEDRLEKLLEASS
ncbi:MAG: TlpA family protein disulfide reductase [Ardenticatenaceae bacterium]|nr:TlpA family protein disulfide reductase [Ardenticatenaceae bacterium]